MTLEEKQEIVRNNKDPSLAALKSMLDRIYELTDDFLNEKGNVKTTLTPDYKAGKFLQSLRDDIPKLEKVREKIQNNDFSLSLVEINYVALAFVYVRARFEKQIKNINEAIRQSTEIINNLMAKKPEESSESEI